jgi:hypothetical protein
VLSGYDWVPALGTRRAIQQEVGKQAILLKLKDVGLGNKVIRLKRYVELPVDARNIYDHAESEWSLGEEQTSWVLVMKTWLARLAGGYPKEDCPAGHHDAKVKEILRLLEQEIEDDRVVIWFRFNDELRAAVTALKKAGYTAAGITGDTPLLLRGARMQSLATGRLRLLCVQIKCGRYGLDMSSASTAIYYSNTYSVNDREQTEKRIEHPKKKKPLTYIDIISRNTVDEDVTASLALARLDSRSFERDLMAAFKERWNANNHSRNTTARAGKTLRHPVAQS